MVAKRRENNNNNYCKKKKSKYKKGLNYNPAIELVGAHAALTLIQTYTNKTKQL